MKVFKRQVELTILHLDPEEASWLHATMQNTQFSVEPEEEGSLDKEMRTKFWEALGGNTSTREHL